MRWTGRSSSSASSDPIRKSPLGMSASSGKRSPGIGRQENNASAFSTTLAAMQLEPFALERFQSIWENRVPLNLAESGVHPLTVFELADSRELQETLLRQ